MDQEYRKIMAERVAADKEWFDKTFAVIKEWMADNGMVQSYKLYGKGELSDHNWHHPDANFSLNVRPETSGGWSSSTNYGVIEIKSRNSIRNFTKKIERTNDKTQEVLAKLVPKIKECVDKKTQDERSQTARIARYKFEKEYMAKHFPDTGKFNVSPDGTTEENIRFNVTARLTPDELRRVLDALDTSGNPAKTASVPIQDGTAQRVK